MRAVTTCNAICLVSPRVDVYGALMTQARPWPHELTKITGQQVQRYRKEWPMTADQLAAAVTALGLPYTRAQVTNLEAGRRDTVTVGELAAFGHVLAVPPVVFIFPVGAVSEVEMLPGVTRPTWDALRWFTGEPPQPFPQGKAKRWLSASEALRQHRQHERLMEELRRSGMRHVSALRTKIVVGDQERPTPADLDAAERIIEAEQRTEQQLENHLMELRQRMRAQGLTLPPLPVAWSYLDDDREGIL